MKRLKKTIRKILTGVLFPALTLNFYACSERSPLKSADKNEPGFTILKSKHTSLSKEFEKSQWIDEDGGTITVGDAAHGQSSLYFPAGAVNDSILVNFWWESTGFLQGGSEFSPHGTNFNLPVRIALSYKDADLTGVDEDDLEIRYYNEVTDEWEFIGDEVDKTRQVVIGYTTHFSRYAIGLE